MVSIPLIGVATALVLCAIIAKAFASGPKKASKSEKAEIMKQLLALSATENSMAGKTPSVAARAPLPNRKPKANPSVNPAAGWTASRK